MKPVFPASLLLVAGLFSPAAVSKQLEIDAGTHARNGSIVTVDSPDQTPEGTVRLKAGDGSFIPLQNNAGGKLSFVLPKLPAGQKSLLTLEKSETPATENATAVQSDDQIRLAIAGKPAATYQMAARQSPRPDLSPKYLRGGYLHPLTTPSGKIVTADYPEGHLHHHGIWTAWTKTKYDGRETDFWNMGAGKGKVDFVSLEKSWSGPVSAGLISHHHFTDLTSGSPVDVLNETWTVTTYAAGNSYHIVDLLSEQTTTGDKPLELPIYHYGGLGIRGLDAWVGTDPVKFITSEGISDRNKANGQSARWICMSGTSDGAPVHLAIFGHPKNFRAPQPVRVHPAEPFISFAPQTNEAMSIKPGETYRSQYRLIISDGVPDPKVLDELWQDYAEPATAIWKD